MSKVNHYEGDPNGCSEWCALNNEHPSNAAEPEPRFSGMGADGQYFYDGGYRYGDDGD